MPAEHPCAGLPPVQRAAFDWVAEGYVPTAEQRLALEPLVAAGLVQAVEIPGEPPVYGIPIPVHVQWAEATGMPLPPWCQP